VRLGTGDVHVPEPINRQPLQPPDPAQERLAFVLCGWRVFPFLVSSPAPGGRPPFPGLPLRAEREPPHRPPTGIMYGNRPQRFPATTRCPLTLLSLLFVTVATSQVDALGKSQVHCHKDPFNPAGFLGYEHARLSTTILDGSVYRCQQHPHHLRCV
jgi:hypothetical protein